MAKLHSYSSLTKNQENLLHKKYCFGSQSLLNLNISKDDFTFHSRIAQKADQTILGSTWAGISSDYFSLKHKRSTDKYSRYKLEITPKQFVQDLKVICDCKLWGGSEPRKDPSVGVEYAHEKATGRVAYHTASSVLAVRLTAGRPEYGVGLKAKADVANVSLTALTAALWWIKGNSSLVVRHTGKGFQLGSLELSYYQELNPSTRLASRVNTDLKSAATHIEVGGDYKLDESTVAKAKINSGGNIGLAFSRELSKNLTATLATEIKTHSIVEHSDSDYKFGFRFDFNS